MPSENIGDRARSAGARRSAAAEQRSLVSELAFVRERAVDITTPTVIVSGLRDRIVPPLAARSLADRIDGARMHMVDAGHLLPAEAPGAVAKAGRDAREAPVNSSRDLPLSPAGGTRDRIRSDARNSSTAVRTTALRGECRPARDGQYSYEQGRHQAHIGPNFKVTIGLPHRRRPLVAGRDDSPSDRPAARRRRRR